MRLLRGGGRRAPALCRAGPYGRRADGSYAPPGDQGLFGLADDPAALYRRRLRRRLRHRARDARERRARGAHRGIARGQIMSVPTAAVIGVGAGRGPADLVVFNAGNNQKIDFRELSAQVFEDFWRVGCFAGFLVGREAARRLVPLGRGTVIFTGASASLRGKPGYAHFAAAKAGLRAIAQSMAREYGPQGIHVAHVVIDGGIDGDRLRKARPQIVAERGEDGLLGVDAIAESFWQIHRQQRSAWTLELDLRPFKESF